MAVKRFLLPGIVLALLVLPHVAHAQGVGAQEVDAILQQFKDATSTWNGKLQPLAMGTFGLLATIDLSMKIAWCSLEKPTMDTVIAVILREILTLGFFWFLLTTTTTWGPQIIDSFTYAAGVAGGGPVSPGDVLDAGLNMAVRVINAASVWSPAQSVGLIIAALVIGLAFAFIVAQWVLTIIESYIVVSIGVLFMAFGGNGYTNDIAIGVLRNVFAVGAKLMAVELTAALGMNLINTWANKFQGGATLTSKDLILEICCAFIFAVISRSVPALVERMAGGSGQGATGGALVGAMGGAAGAAVGGAAATAGALTSGAGAASAVGAGVSAARSSVASQVQQGLGPQGAAAKAATIAGRAINNVAAGVGRELGGRLTGQTFPRGYAGFRIAKDIKQRQGGKP